MAVRNNSDALNELVHGVDGVEGLQSKIDKKAPLNSPALTGTPTAPTPAKNVAGSDRLATTAYVLSLLKNNPEIIDDILNALDKKIGSANPTFTGTMTFQNKIDLTVSKDGMTHIDMSNGGIDISSYWNSKLQGIEFIDNKCIIYADEIYHRNTKIFG